MNAIPNHDKYTNSGRTYFINYVSLTGLPESAAATVKLV